jgi:hypothetical protein
MNNLIELARKKYNAYDDKKFKQYKDLSKKERNEKVPASKTSQKVLAAMGVALAGGATAKKYIGNAKLRRLNRKGFTKAEMDRIRGRKRTFGGYLENA